MRPDRWQQIDALFHAAAERAPHEREAFLDEACAGNDSLRREVESLLAADSAAEGVATAKLPGQVAAEMLRAEGLRLASGQSLNQYRILAPLGAGGMGEVWLAEDTRLKRKIALKLLPAQFTNDADRVRRFEQEALAVSALNHPNILTIYEIGESDRHHFLVTEFIEGQTLRQQMNDGRLPVRAVLNVATQIVSALAAAHAAGIIHRDIKPENIMVRPDGVTKVLDFGLAKLSEPRAPTVDPAEKKASTESGVVMGTIGYMSPEQVRGQKVDHRSDIFAVGVILYEMLSGQRAFTGDSAVEVMNAILKEEPPELAETNAKISPALDKIVRRCLEKNPERRFHSAHDLGFALEALSAPSSSNAAAVQTPDARLAKRSSWRERVAWLAAGVLALIALALGVTYFNRPASDARVVRLAFAPPESLAFDNGLNDYVVVSPDGQKLVFTGRSADGKRQLWVRLLDAGEATPMPGTDDPVNPFWSPDNRSIGFGSQGKLKRIDLAGGRPQTLCDAPNFRGGTWSRAGVIIFTPNVGSGLFQVPATGGEPKSVISPDPARREFAYLTPYFLPDGRHFVYRVEGMDGENGVFVGSLDSKEVKQLLTDGTSAIYAAPGWLLFTRNGAVLAQAFDPVGLELKDEAVPLTRPTNIANVAGVPFSASETGVLVWQGNRQREYRLVWFDREGKQGGTVGAPIKVERGQAPRLSPDGKRVAIQRIEPEARNSDIWVIELVRNLPTRLTSDPAYDQFPIWSPDGSRVVFQTNRGSVTGLYQKAASGAGPEELLLNGGGFPTEWSADERFILYSRIGEKTRWDVWALPLTGSRQPYPLINTEFAERQAQLSPKGRWLVYVSDESGSNEVYLQPFSVEGKLGGDKMRISSNGGDHPRFRRDGQELFYVAADGQMMAVKINGSRFETPRALFKTRMLTGIQAGIEYDVTVDGQRFLIGTVVGEPAPVNVILNWTAGLKP